MSGKLIPTLLGLDANTPKSPRIPRPLLIMLIATLSAVYLSNAFSSPLTSLMIQAKWLPLGMLAIMAAYMAKGRATPDFPKSMWIPMLAMVGVAVINTGPSMNPGFALLSAVTVFGSIWCGYAVSAIIVATDSRRAYFELLANFCRVLVVITMLCTLLGLNLGRGAGLSAWSDNPNTLAMVLTPGMAIFLAGCIERKPGWQVMHAAFFVICFYLVWATNSRACVVWIGMSLAAFWLYRRGPGLAVLLAMTGLIIVVGWWYPIKVYLIDTLGLNWNARTGGISPLSGREEVWKIGWDLFWKRPLLGYGLGSSQELIRSESYKFVRHQGLHFHSSYIMAMVELGVFGLIGMMSAIVISLGRGIADASRTRVLPRESWPFAALPFALVLGSLGHAVFESWLIASGNANMMLFWTWVWMIHHQSQVKIRAVIHRDVTTGPILTATPLAAR